MLLLHLPNWRNLIDMKYQCSGIDIFQQFLTSHACPNFVKVEVERAKNHLFPQMQITNHDEKNYDDSTEDNDDPEWVSLMMRPNAQFKEINSEFMCDDGGLLIRLTTLTRHGNLLGCNTRFQQST